MNRKIINWTTLLLVGMTSNILSQITIQAGAELTVMEGEELTVEGSVDNFGEISGKGMFSIAGDFLSFGTFAIEIDATSHTAVNVGGKFTSEGTFTVTDNSTPSNDDQITIVTAGDPLGSVFTNSESNNWFANYNIPNDGEFTISYLGILPVELLEFSGIWKEAVVLLEWQTASEINNLGFAIERSHDADRWETIGFLEGAGTSNDYNSYKYQDESPKGGLNYYRLKQMDIDGKINYSKTISVDVPVWVKEFSISPNPADNKVSLTLSTPLENDVLVQLIDKFGRVIKSNTIERGQDQTSIDVSIIPSGIYYVQITEGFRQITKKLVKQKL